MTGGRLTVLNVSYPLAPVGPDSVGGAEQVLAAIDRGLVAAGHRSLIIAPYGSRVCGELLAIPAAAAPFDDATRAAAQAQIRSVMAGWLDRVDIVHLHGVDFDTYIPSYGPPVLATLHLPPSWYPAAALRPERPRTWIHCVSHGQDRALRSLDHTEAVLDPIENGVDLEALATARHGRRGFALTLGRICPEKGQDLALAAAHRAGVGLLIGGIAYPYATHQSYFRDRVAPLLDSRRRHLGALGPVRKRRLLAAARCLLAPSTAPETSSLVTMEALACGTPVIAFPSGALADLIENGRTGFLVRDVDEMAAAIGRTGEIDPAACRAAARDRFDQRRMLDGYLSAYARLAAT